MATRRFSSGVVTVTLLATMAAACGTDEPDPDFEGVCMSLTTQTRIDDENCDDDDSNDGHHGHGWIYYPISSHTSHPPVGAKVASGYTTTRPSAGFYSVPRTGGFGSHGGKVSG